MTETMPQFWTLLLLIGGLQCHSAYWEKRRTGKMSWDRALYAAGAAFMLSWVVVRLQP
jgi:hypothetical protein